MRYLAHMMAAAVFVIGLVMALHLTVDPYSLFGFKDWAYWNEFKPRVGGQEAEFKRVLAARGEFEYALIGNSRVNTGFDPADWPAGKMVNLGSGGQDLEDSLDILRLISTNPKAPVKKLFLFVDLSQFYQMGQMVLKERVEPGSLSYFARYAWTLSGFGDVLETVWSNWTLRDGDDCALKPFDLENGASCQPREADAAGFARRARDEERGMCGLYRFIQPRLDPRRSTLVFLREALLLAERRRMPLALVLAPLHPRHLALIDHLGRWEDFELFKRHLLGLAYPRFEVWDYAYVAPVFSSDSDWTEITHFRRSLGAVVLRSLFTPEDRLKIALSPGLGNSVMEEQKAWLRIWKERNPQVLAEIAESCR